MVKATDSNLVAW